MKKYIKADGLSFSYPGGARVLTDVTFTVGAGQVAGLIGENGSGKSTTLSLLAGQLTPDSGTLHLPERTRYLPQEVSLRPDNTVQDLIDHAVGEVQAIETDIIELSARLAEAPNLVSLSSAYDEALARADAFQLWTLDSRIEQVLTGLGVEGLDRHSTIAEISGGQRRLLALAMLLVSPADCLLIDEPTNHLDDQATDFIIEELNNYRGPVITSSHNRYFLDNAATCIIDLDPGLAPEGGRGESTRQATFFTGSFSDYLEERDKTRTRWQSLYNAQENERAMLENKLEKTEEDIFHSTENKSETRMAAKFYADRAAKTAGTRIRSARNRLEELDRNALPAPPKPLTFATGRTDSVTLTRSSDPSISLFEIAVEDRMPAVDLDVLDRDHILIQGDNGAGKSTLLGVIAGTVPFTEGFMTIVEGLSVGYLAQDSRWEDLSLTAAATFDQATPAGSPSLEEMGLLTPDVAALPMRALSLGQRRRVAIGITLASPPDIVLLDEPTNHISLTLAEDLERAIASFPGIVIVASHDRWLRDRWVGRKLLMDHETGVQELKEQS